MSIFKSEQRDKRRFVSWLKGNLLGRTCPSYINPPNRNQRIPLTCELKQGHAGKHKAFVDTEQAISWGYGDNWLDTDGS